jgi:hypothetical protein
MSNLSDFFGSSGTIASIQRGTTTIAISQAGANTPMSTFTNKSTLNISVANGMYGRYYSNWGLTTSISANGTLTNATTLTFTAGKGFSNYTALGTPEAVIVQWEIIEYV